MQNCDVKEGNLVREKTDFRHLLDASKTLLPLGLTFPTDGLGYYVSLFLQYLTSRLTASVLTIQISMASWVTFAVWEESGVLGSFFTSTHISPN